MKSVKYIPDGYHTATPYITVNDTPGLIEFLQRAFGATETSRINRPDGAIMHAEIRIGDSPIMLSEACQEMGPMPASLYLYLEEADAAFARAVEAGATPIMEPADMLWGDRFGCVKDAWGNQWSISTHIEDVAPEDLDKRARLFAEQ
jgi:PhnB protein